MENKQTEVLAILKSAYKRWEAVDLHQQKGLHGRDEVIGLVDLIEQDKDLLALASLAPGSIIGGHHSSLCIDGDGLYLFQDWYGDGNPDGVEIIRDVRTFFREKGPSFSGSELKDAVLAYIREAPYEER